MKNKIKIIIGISLIISMLLAGVSCNQSSSEENSSAYSSETQTETVENNTTLETESDKNTESEETSETETPTETETETVPEITDLPEQEVKVISQNVLCDEKTVSKRAPAMINSLLSFEPDSFGVQECIKPWARRLDIDLKDKYARVGVDCYGEDIGWFGTYIYYLKDKYTVIDSATFWMSNTPDVPSQFNDHVDVMNRTCTWAILENKETGFRYVHINCHLDWADPSANIVQIQMIRNLILRFDAMGYPVFATGDYNSKEGSDSYKAMLASELIADSRYVADKTTDTVSHYGNKSSVDFCFVTKNKMQVLEFDIIHNVREDVEVSDHNGVYTYAKVQSLPVQDHSKTLVSFADDAKITAVKDSRYGYLMSITFTQARTLEGSVASSYEVIMQDQSGKDILTTTVYGGQYCAIQSDEVNFKLSDGVLGEKYTLIITPISIFGEKGEPISQSIEWLADPDAPEPPPAPDIIDISVKEGKVVDATANKYTISQVGNVTVTEDAMVFNKEGNIRTSSIASQYGKMTNGFTLEAVITTSNDLNSMAHYSSNLHAGGFGLYTNKGMLHFVVHNGKDYIPVTYTVEKNTKYHIVGVFDGKMLMLYINGELVNSVELGGAMKLPTVEKAEYLCFGADVNADGSGETLSQCTVYRIAIYSGILTNSEISYLYSNY